MSETTIAKVRRSCVNREIRDLLVAALKTGVRHRLTRSGITLYAPDGVLTVGTHFSVSDHRAARNLRADLKKAGIL